MTKSEEELYPFHEANIHERRMAARVFRAFPLASVLGCMTTIVYAVLKDEMMLLMICAIMNVALWLWITTTSLLGMAGSWIVANELKAREQNAVTGVKPSPFSSPRNEGDSDNVMHLIVFPNYKEDEGMLAETLTSLSEAEDSHNFHVVMAMEEREGENGQKKGMYLQDKFKSDFAGLRVTMHPSNLQQDHLDDSVDAEVPGKASNLKWAVNQSYDVMQKEYPHRLHNVILTIADADCMFHPEYFSAITKDVNELREKPGGSEHQWCMWQAPQLSYRDHWHAPVCSRVWTYISSMYEFGGVSGLYWGGHHMVFSGYSMPLQLAASAQSWDGDVIAEDHHAYLKTFFYSAHTSAMQAMSPQSTGDGCQPMLQVRPIFLPVKSSPVISNDGYWQNYVERWHQAKRHAQGIAELSCSMLMMWDTICTLPVSTYSWSLFYKMSRIFMRLVCMHILPVCQAFGLATMTLYWFYFSKKIYSCPNDLKIFDMFHTEYPLCAFGGAWTLVWPMAIPFVCLIVANYMMVSCTFLMPGRKTTGQSTWDRQDGGIEPLCGSKQFAAFVCIATDCAVFLSIMMIPYGLIACLLAMWNVCFYGNRFNYITAAKAVTNKGAYGTMNEPASESKQPKQPEVATP